MFVFTVVCFSFMFNISLESREFVYEKNSLSFTLGEMFYGSR